jgi:hypothetical protein
MKARAKKLLTINSDWNSNPTTVLFIFTVVKIIVVLNKNIIIIEIKILFITIGENKLNNLVIFKIS